MSTLVVVPCGKLKIWKQNPIAGPTPAQEAYKGQPFKVNREYALSFGDRWVILSAKYGFIEPAFLIPQDYDVTFSNLRSGPISSDHLKQQAEDMGLARFEIVVCLGGKAYRKASREAFSGTSAEVICPFEGLYPPGVVMQRMKLAIARNESPRRTLSFKTNQ